MELLGGNEESYRLRLDTPFDKEKLKKEIYPANTRFKARKRTIHDIEEKIRAFIKEKVGNYLIFFPSYEYLELFKDTLKDDLKEYELIIQNKEMTEADREEFINNFREKRNVIGVCVLGGIFSEGIDLPGDMLIGAVIVGVGYPKISIEREIIRDYFNEKGYDYSYIYPGINKVLQAAGRVIRTEFDEGRVLFIDDRYLSGKYKIVVDN